MPSGYDPLADMLDPKAIQSNLDDIRSVVRKCAEAMPPHQEFVDQHCSASSPATPIS